jgi:hypothetical protein
VARMGRNVAQPSETRAIDPRDEPSAEWGWHGDFPRAGRIAGAITVIILLTLLIGPHQGRVEDLWIVGIAAVLAFLLVRSTLRARRAWRR